MTLFFILMGVLLCSIIITIAQISFNRRKDMNDLMQLFERVETDK